MHYVISVAMMKHDTWTRAKATQVLFDQCRHVCNAVAVIKARAASQKPFRELLYQAAEAAREQGAQSIALNFLKHSLQLLPEDPWNDSANHPEEQYGETLTLYTQTAASYWFMGQFEEASMLAEEIHKRGKVPADRSAAFIIQSRIAAQKGDSRAAIEAMNRAMADLGYQVESNMTWEDCDDQFRNLLPLVKQNDPDLSDVQEDEIDRELTTIGAVLVELLSACFWSDTLLFYQLTLKIMGVYLERGIFPQLSVGYIHLATIAIGRFDMVEYGIEAGNIAKQLMVHFRNETYSNGRGLTLLSLFVGHLETGIRDQMPVLEEGLENSVAAGDKILHLLNIGITAAFRLWISEDLQEIETWITDLREIFPSWETDLRG